MTTIGFGGQTRRDFLYVATGAVAAVGAAAVAWPLISQMNPDASTIAAGAPIEVDLAPIADGQMIKVFWRGKPIFVMHRTKKEIKEAEDVNVASLPDPQPDSARVKEGHAQWLVVFGNCTHLGCIPIAQKGNYDGWFCPCHGSVFDTSGRIRQGPAPLNLADSALRLHLRHQDQDRLTAEKSRPNASFHSSGLHHERTIHLPAAELRPEVDRAASADHAASSIPRSSPIRRRAT